MKISAIIPAYNAEQTIARAVKSVLAQTRPADEIIVIDDGSTDGTAEAIRAFGDKVILIQQENAGVSVARNAGIRAAAGDWIAFLDADDEWLPDKLKLQSEHLQRHPDLKWGFTNLLWDRTEHGTFEPSHPTGRLEGVLNDVLGFDDYFYAYQNGFYISTITIMIHRSVFETVGMFEPGMKRAQDNDLWFRIGYQFPQVGYIAEPLAVYHLDTPSSSTKINDTVDFMVSLVRRHEQLSKQYNRHEQFRPCIAYMVQIWIRQLMDQKRYTDTKHLLTEFRQYLSNRFQREMHFRLLCPPVTNACADVVMNIKKAVRRGG